LFLPYPRRTITAFFAFDVDDSVIEVAAELLLSEGIGVALGVWAGDVAVGVR
jgi:hypothetical protein